MNNLIVKIKNIKHVQNLNIIEFDFFGKTLNMISLELSENLKIEKQVQISVKPTNVIISANLSGEISLSNKLIGQIYSIEIGEILVSIILKIKNHFLESIITKDSFLEMDIRYNDEVFVLINASDIYIQDVLND